MAITIDQATADKTGATARAYAAQNRASNSTKPITIEQATADKTGATARAFAAQNVANKANITPSGTVGNTLTSSNMRPTTPISVTQPQIATGSTILATDIISKGQADTARAMAEEAKIAQQQGMAVPTATSEVIKNILAQSSGTPTNTSPQGTQTGTEPLNVNGITAADTLASQRQGIQDAITTQATESGLRASIYGEAVDPARKELNDINARINDEALAGRRREEAVLTIPGITKTQAQDKINEIKRVNASQLADLAVVQMAKQGQFDSAREIADRAIDARLEEQKNRNQALLFTYQENKELFTKAEQRAFEAEQKKRDREYETEKQTLTQISNLALSALESGAPASVVSRMQKAKTLAEATSIGGQYVGKLDREVKLANIRQSNAAAAASNRSNQPMNISGADYNNNQIKYITSLNEAVSKNDTYKKTTNAKTYTDNVITALSQGTGTGDLAAINQFQKVIDEGAVTRDQDVKLIQQSQSLVNSIQSKFKKLGTGQQLSPQLRAEMRDAVSQLYSGQVQALQKDPYIASKLAETRLYGVNATDTILGEISNINQAQQIQQIAPEKEQIFNSIVGIQATNSTVPNVQTIIPFNLNNFKK